MSRIVEPKSRLAGGEIPEVESLLAAHPKAGFPQFQFEEYQPGGYGDDDHNTTPNATCIGYEDDSRNHQKGPKESPQG